MDMVTARTRRRPTSQRDMNPDRLELSREVKKWVTNIIIIIITQTRLNMRRILILTLRMPLLANLRGSDRAICVPERG
jgi:hypothetical protein